jgi:predicted DNA-binding transcriptional regulator AlpA
MDEAKLIDANILARRLGVIRREIYAWLRGPNPPPVYRLGKNRLRFFEGEVREWLSRRRVRQSP